jgi:hypothetical protein
MRAEKCRPIRWHAENFMNLAEQFMELIRLGDESSSDGQLSRGAKRRLRKAGGEQDFERRQDAGRLRGEVDSAYPRGEDDVGKEQVDRLVLE